MRIAVRTLLMLLGLLMTAGAVEAKRVRPSCGPRSAVATTIESVRSDYRRWAGTCVTVRGVVVGRRLYSDRTALLERRDPWGEDARRSIAIYPQRRPRYEGPPVEIEITGTTGSCAQQNAALRAEQQAHADEILMLGGFCHTSMEVFVSPAEIRTISNAPVPRFREAEVPADRRELVDAPLDLLQRNEQIAVARAMAMALATGDEVAYFRLSHAEDAEEQDRLGDKPAPNWLRRELREGRVDYRRLAPLRRAFAEMPPLAGRSERVLVKRDDLEAVGSGNDLEPIVCWCKTADCTGHWPVLAMDIDNAPTRPYLCILPMTLLVGPGKGVVLQAKVPMKSDGFAEPDWSARRQPDGVGSITPHDPVG